MQRLGRRRDPEWPFVDGAGARGKANADGPRIDVPSNRRVRLRAVGPASLLAAVRGVEEFLRKEIGR